MCICNPNLRCMYCSNCRPKQFKSPETEEVVFEAPPTTEYIGEVGALEQTTDAFWFVFLGGWCCGTLFWVGLNYLFGG